MLTKSFILLKKVVSDVEAVVKDLIYVIFPHSRAQSASRDRALTLTV